MDAYKLADEAMEYWKDLARQNTDREATLSTWIVVGNGAALVWCFDAAISGDLHSLPFAKWYALAFFVGLFFSAVGFGLSLVAQRRTTNKLLKVIAASRRMAANMELIDNLAQLGGAQADIQKTTLELEKDRKILEQGQIDDSVASWLNRGSLAFRLLGVCAFGGGIVHAIFSSAVVGL